MKPAIFDYEVATSIEHAVRLLSSSDNSKIIAGGQSLMPIINFRLLEPSLLVDITRLPDLQGIKSTLGGGISIGASTKHHELETSLLIKERFPLISDAMKHVAHLAIRNKGTIGGSLSHADPAAELPLLMLLLDAVLHITGPTGLRKISVKEFLVGALTTILEDNEILTRIDIPSLPKRTNFAFNELSQRAGDLALCAVGVTISMSSGMLGRTKKIKDARIGLMGVNDTAIRISEAENLLIGRSSLDSSIIDQVAQICTSTISPNTDLHASADFRRHLALQMTKKTLTEAWEKAQASKTSENQNKENQSEENL